MKTLQLLPQFSLYTYISLPFQYTGLRVRFLRSDFFINQLPFTRRRLFK